MHNNGSALCTYNSGSGGSVSGGSVSGGSGSGSELNMCCVNVNNVYFCY